MKDKFEKSQKKEAITVHGEKKTFETYKKNNKGHKYVFVKLSEYKKLVGSTHKKMKGGGDMGLLVTTDNVKNITLETFGSFIVKIFKEGDKDKYEVVPIPPSFNAGAKKDFLLKYLDQKKEGEVYLLNELNSLCEFITETGNAASVPVVPASPATPGAAAPTTVPAAAPTKPRTT
jgi:hypothetical protein